MIINTMGWIDGLGYQLLLHSIKALKVDVIMVVGQDRLHNQLKSEFRCKPSHTSLLKASRFVPGVPEVMCRYSWTAHQTEYHS